MKPTRLRTIATRIVSAALLAALGGCAGTPSVPPYPSAREGRALVNRLLPRALADRDGWATDLFAAFAAMQIPPTDDNVCVANASAFPRSCSTRPRTRSATGR